MLARIAVALALSLLGCASSASSVREESSVAAPASASGPAASAEAVPARVSYAVPGGWSVRNASDGIHLFHPAPQPAVLRMALEPTDASPSDRARQEAAALTARGATVGPIESVGNYASFTWHGDLGSGQRHGRVAIRRPSGASGSLIVMSGLWPPASDPLAEQVDMLFLLATTR